MRSTCKSGHITLLNFILFLALQSTKSLFLQRLYLYLTRLMLRVLLTLPQDKIQKAPSSIPSAQLHFMEERYSAIWTIKEL